MPSGTATSLGRFQAPEAPSALMRLHWFHPEKVTLRTVDHEPKVAVLDQEDLRAQGIRCSTFIPGAGDPDALGSCTCNTETEAFSNILTPTQFAEFVATMGKQPAPADPYNDTVAAERAAIGTYHAVTDQTADSSSEWPPTDCGSSGPYLYKWALANGYIGGEEIAHGADNICSLMQTDGALWGTPWLNAWFQPGADHCIDGDGSRTTLEEQINQGVAGGHEIYLSAIEKLTVLPTGHVDPFKTVLRFRNHWSKSWGDSGSGYVHLSTLVALGNAIDVRRFNAKAA